MSTEPSRPAAADPPGPAGPLAGPAPLAADFALAAAALLGAAVLWIGSADLPPPRWEPLGSAAFPRALAGFLVVFGLWIAVAAALRLRAAAPSSAPDAAASSPPDAAALTGRMRGLALFAALVAFVFALDRLSAPFVPAATVFITVAALILSRFTWRNLAFAAIGGGLLSTAVFLALTRLFFINLG